MPCARPSRLVPRVALPALGAVLVSFASGQPARAAAVHLFDAVPVADAVNDFEAAPATVADAWVQQGIRVSQVQGDVGADAIWLASGLGLGQRSWYPDAGDNGWTRITRVDGEAFAAVSMLAGSGWLGPPQEIFYQLQNGGAVVSSGTIAADFDGRWITFSGGDFDSVLLRAGRAPLQSLTDCPGAGDETDELTACNFLWLDHVKIGALELGPGGELPVPGTALLAAAGLAVGWRLGRPRRSGAAASCSAAQACR